MKEVIESALAACTMYYLWYEHFMKKTEDQELSIKLANNMLGEILGTANGSSDIKFKDIWEGVNNREQ